MCGQRNNGYWIETFVHFIRANKLGSLHAAHERHGYVHLEKRQYTSSTVDAEAYAQE